MKIFSADQIKKWDAYTITHEPIASIDLMERAATACCKWLLGKNFGQQHFRIFCGKGNNGGDGLAMARILIEHKCRVTVYILEFGNIGTPDFQTNLEKLHLLTTDIHFIQSPDFFPPIPENDIVIDALFGTGLNKPLEGISQLLVNHINQSGCTIIAIDMPSGLYADRSSAGNTVISAGITLSFQHYKLAFLVPENEVHCGEVHLLNIGLSREFESRELAAYEWIDPAIPRALYKPRPIFAHKGNFGHAQLIAGSYGMMGAAVLSARACLRSGAGKLTCLVPECGYTILQSAVPEAMCTVNGDRFISDTDGVEKYDAIGIGPGIGIHASHRQWLERVFQEAGASLVIDADALNVLARHPELLSSLPPLTILTPHPREFERLFGPVPNDFERIGLAMESSRKYNVIIVVKGHYSFIACPDGQGYFNSSGNPGMATAGSGDVLTGILTGLLARGYPPKQATLLGVYLHGLAGDIAAAKNSPEALIAGDISNCLGEAFMRLQVV